MNDRIMKKWGLTALAATTVAGIGALVWQLRSNTPPAVGEASGETAAKANATGSSNGLPGPTRHVMGAEGQSAEPATPNQDDGRPAPLTREERSSIDMERVLHGELPRQIRSAAAHCYDGANITYKQLEDNNTDIGIDFTLTLKNGTVTIDDVVLTEGIDDPETEQCVVGSVEEVTWKDPVNPDFSMELSDAISLLALKKYGEPMPHEMAEVVEDNEEEQPEFGPQID